MTVKLEEVNGVATSFSPGGSGLALLTSTIENKKARCEPILLDTIAGKERRRFAAPKGARQVTPLADGRTVLVLEVDKLGRMQVSLRDTQTG